MAIVRTLDRIRRKVASEYGIGSRADIGTGLLNAGVSYNRNRLDGNRFGPGRPIAATLAAATCQSDMTYRACWMAESIQWPPRERTNVQISVAVTCSVVLPSTTRPAASLVASIIENRIATVA